MAAHGSGHELQFTNRDRYDSNVII